VSIAVLKKVELASNKELKILKFDAKIEDQFYFPNFC
jgi:hypothetical protein